MFNLMLIGIGVVIGVIIAVVFIIKYLDESIYEIAWRNRR